MALLALENEKYEHESIIRIMNLNLIGNYRDNSGADSDLYQLEKIVQSIKYLTAEALGFGDRIMANAPTSGSTRAI
jgi:hypothetical protein